MRTAAQCLVKAANMDRCSDSSGMPVDAANYERLAHEWRRIARMAARQDQFTHLSAGFIPRL